MAEAPLLKSSNGSKKRKRDTAGGNKSKKSLASTSTANISETFEVSMVDGNNFLEALVILLSLNDVIPSYIP